MQIKYEELRDFDEIIAVGTAAALVPIKSITRRSTGDKLVYLEGGSSRGPCCERLLLALQNIQRGIEPDPFGWCEKVLPPDGRQ